MKLIRAHAPGRCGIVGNPTDMYGGSVISCSTCERAECRLLPGGTNIILRNGDIEDQITHISQLVQGGDTLDIARAALMFYGIDPANHSFQLETSTTIPMRAGMAGSTALLAAIVGAVDAYLDLKQSCYLLAENTRRIESGIMGIVCGHQDQHMAIFGGLNFMNFAGKESLKQLPDEPLATVEPLAGRCSIPPLLLAHTGIQHHSGTVHKSPRERWLAGDEEVHQAYKRIAQLASVGKRAMVEGNWQHLGSLMNENHEIVARLGGSGEANDRLINVARTSGAFGAKLAGAGGGGTIIALVRDMQASGSALLAAGAEQLLISAPQPGLTVEIS